MTSYLTTFNLQDCQQMLNSKFVHNGEIYYVNPKTNKPIKASANTYKTFEKYCKQLQSQDNDQKSSVMQKAKSKTKNTHDLINQWLQNPLKNPKNGDIIKVDISHKSTYVKWYVTAYKTLDPSNYTEIK